MNKIERLHAPVWAASIALALVAGCVANPSSPKHTGPADIYRLDHVALHVRDLAKSADFTTLCLASSQLINGATPG